MHSYKKIISSIVTIILITSFFSGCIDDVFSNDETDFTIHTWYVYDYEGFPCLSLVFTCSDLVTINLYNPSDILLDSDSFLEDENKEAFFHLASYGKTVYAGDYQIKVLDNNNKQVYEKDFSLTGLNLTILSCDQKWWKHDLYTDDYSLVGLNLRISNNGETPVYPYNIDVSMDSSIYPGIVIPDVVLPGRTKELDCFVYKPGNPVNDMFSLKVEDRYGTTLATGSFDVSVQDNVDDEEFRWNYKNSPYSVKLPMLDFYYDYYSSIDRYQHEDYCLYIFDLLDDLYLDMIINDCIMSDFVSNNDVEKINYAASFVQYLDYKKDSLTDDSYEYPRYPIETLFNNGGDCEDKAILTACILNHLGYDVTLIRLTNHMAVGVNLSTDLLPAYDQYINNYYYLETTTEGKTVGYVPKEHRNPAEVDIFNVSNRPLLTHNWDNNLLTIFTNTVIGDYVKVIVYVENIGIKTATNVKVEGVFYTETGVEINAENEIISSIKPGSKEKVILTINIPKGRTTLFKTRLYLDKEVVDIRESASTFPV